MQASAVRVNWRFVVIAVGVVVGFWIINRLSDKAVSTHQTHKPEHTATVKHAQDVSLGKRGRLMLDVQLYAISGQISPTDKGNKLSKLFAIHFKEITEVVILLLLNLTCVHFKT